MVIENLRFFGFGSGRGTETTFLCSRSAIGAVCVEAELMELLLSPKEKLLDWDERIELALIIPLRRQAG